MFDVDPSNLKTDENLKKNPRFGSRPRVNNHEFFEAISKTAMFCTFAHYTEGKMPVVLKIHKIKLLDQKILPIFPIFPIQTLIAILLWKKGDILEDQIQTDQKQTCQLL